MLSTNSQNVLVDIIPYDMEFRMKNHHSLLFFVNFRIDDKLYLNTVTYNTFYKTISGDNLTLPTDDILDVLPFGNVLVDVHETF